MIVICIIYMNQIAHQILEILNFFLSRVSFLCLRKICSDVKLNDFRPFSSTKGRIEYANFRGHAFFRRNIEFLRDTRVPVFGRAYKREREWRRGGGGEREKRRLSGFTQLS